VSFSRRRLFGFLTDAAREAVSAVGERSTASPRPAAESPAATEAVESALEILATAGPEYGGDGLSNHGPMAADALVALGRPAAVVPWVERYRRRIAEPIPARRPIDGERWRESLGDYARAGDWSVFFRRAIADHSWQEVLSEWTLRLAPGAGAAAFHGLIRTAHAARSLGRHDSPARRRELAEGLAYWAARYQPLPDTSSWRSDGRLPSDALADITVLRARERDPVARSISDALHVLNASPEFAAVTGLVDSRVDASRLVSDLTKTFGRVYVARGAPDNAIALLHAVTGPAAVRLLLPYVDDQTSGVLLRHVWHGAAALFAVYGGGVEGLGGGALPGEDEVPSPLLDRETLADRAQSTGDEHAIKLAEACLRENEIAPSAVYLAAALDGTTRFRAE